MSSENPLVSIIIPTYNRANLIGETLNSILAQSYNNWECIVVDDGSIDNTAEILSSYVKKDSRIKYCHRPSHHLSGGNGARNYGLKKAIGAYLIFFDSDDIMTPDHLVVKVEAMIMYKCDYVITKTKFINNKKKVGNNNYRFNLYPLTPFNYVSQAINWLTYDVCIKTCLAQSIKFNEELLSGQEYNYFSKLVHFSINAKFIDKIVTLRRYHGDSIRTKLNSEQKRLEGSFKAKWYTYCDLLGIADKETRLNLLYKCVLLIYDSKTILIKDKVSFIKAIFREYHWRGGYFLLMLFSLKLFGKGYFFFNKLASQ